MRGISWCRAESRPGRFYALPQAPQQYKQLLMVAGVEKYFQIAKCFRDEDLRADRQPEFTQIDIEASFVTPDDIFAVTEGMLAAIFKAARNIDIKTPFDRLTYREALDRYGSDKPDRRFEMELVDLGETFRESSFKVFRGALDAGGVVKAINAKGFAGITIGQADELTEIAKLHGAKGLAFIKIENGEWKSPIVKFFSDAEKTALQSKLNIEEGDCVFFAADKWEIACEVLGRLRLRIAEMQKLTPAGEVWNFLWVTDFPLFEWSPDENKWNAMHHPFTRPKAEDMPLFEAKKFPEVRAEAYDVVLNGVEIGGGSMRIYEPELQDKMFAALGISPEARESQFGHLLRAFRLGAPPHGGIAFGFDRLVMLICGERFASDGFSEFAAWIPDEIHLRNVDGIASKLSSAQSGRYATLIPTQRNFRMFALKRMIVVLNGVEIGGGSMRIYERAVAGENVRSSGHQLRKR